MTQEDKKLLLKDLSARLPYYPKCEMIDRLRVINNEPNPSYIECLFPRHLELFSFHNNFVIKPYLRPMSSMTEEEEEEYHDTMDIETQRNYPFSLDFSESIYYLITIKTFDWLNAHYFDYRGLIKKGLALEAPEDMYK